MVPYSVGRADWDSCFPKTSQHQACHVKHCWILLNCLYSFTYKQVGRILLFIISDRDCCVWSFTLFLLPNNLFCVDNVRRIYMTDKLSCCWKWSLLTLTSLITCWVRMFMLWSRAELCSFPLAACWSTKQRSAARLWMSHLHFLFVLKSAPSAVITIDKF